MCRDRRDHDVSSVTHRGTLIITRGWRDDLLKVPGARKTTDQSYKKIQKYEYKNLLKIIKKKRIIYDKNKNI